MKIYVKISILNSYANNEPINNNIIQANWSYSFNEISLLLKSKYAVEFEIFKIKFKLIYDTSNVMLKITSVIEINYINKLNIYEKILSDITQYIPVIANDYNPNDINIIIKQYDDINMNLISIDDYIMEFFIDILNKLFVNIYEIIKYPDNTYDSIYLVTYNDNYNENINLILSRYENFLLL